MKVCKQTVTHLTKCYSLARIVRGGEEAFLVASEKQFPCIVIDRKGKVLDKVWDGPGGVMTMEPLDRADGAFLATHRFYSPNDSKNASIVLAWPEQDGWQVKTLCKLPFVHRFGLLKRDGKTYIVAATLKSDHQFKEDWTCPGRIWVGELPQNLDSICEENPMILSPLVSGLYRNHGFFKYEEDGYTVCLVGTDNGIYKITPPAKDGDWVAERIFEGPASDMLLADFDGDGEKELMVLSPFHGEALSVYKYINGAWETMYQAPELPFLHALAVGALDGRAVAVVGHRKGDRDLLLLSCSDGTYRCDVLDHDVGPANVLCSSEDDALWILSANRETDEVAMYTVAK